MGTCRFVLCTGVRIWANSMFISIFISYVLTGTNTGFQETFGSTCHGAVSRGCIDKIMEYVPYGSKFLWSNIFVIFVNFAMITKIFVTKFS